MGRKKNSFMGKLDRRRGDALPIGDLWGKGTLLGRERGLIARDNLSGKIVRRKEDLWGKDE